MDSDAQLAEVGQGDLVLSIRVGQCVCVQDYKSLMLLRDIVLRLPTPWLTNRQTPFEIELKKSQNEAHFGSSVALPIVVSCFTD